MIDKKVGSKIKQIRKSWGITQIELAEKIGTSFQQIQKYEKGSTRISVMRLEQISKALGIDINVFFETEEKPFKVSDQPLKYIPEQDTAYDLQPLSKEEITLLKIFRKIKNKNLKEGMLKQLRGVSELEKQKQEPA